ncbi:hypothetical protein [Streptomyces sp. MBT53]|uniref:hypothetical protein n=1 Tax=Streptomyces sp. MBT53 TaxID=1488384 RepID=UPI001911BF19|nr:hypothetical protein [Streptomyces sp. MBT53]MBK6014466.1 hypothetical protein [Streptomyces sp. MBT53]
MAKTDADDDSGNSDPNINNNDYGDNGSGNDDSTGSSGDHRYHGGTNVLHVPGILDDRNNFVPPPVPGGDGHNGTSISTPSMDLLASNVDLLIQPVRDAATKLNDVAIAPGAFYHANVMRTKINGANADGGLKKSYTDALSALVTGLTDLRDGVRSLSRHYATTEEANNMSAHDLSDAFTTTAGDFNRMMTSNGGTGITTSTSNTGTGDTGTGNSNTTTT